MLAALLPERISVDRPVLVSVPEAAMVPERVWALAVMPVEVGTTERVSMVRSALPRLMGPEKVWLRVPYCPSRSRLTLGPTKMAFAMVGATVAFHAVRVELPEM